MGPPMWPWRCGLTAHPVSGVEWRSGDDNTNKNMFIEFRPQHGCLIHCKYSQ